MRLNQKIAVLVLATSTAVAGFSAQAASIDVKVVGTITPGSCTPTLAGGGTIDYGTIPATEVSPSDFTVLAEKSVAFTITCSAPAKVAVSAVDNRVASVVPRATTAIGAVYVDLYNFGLGTASGAKVGGYIMKFDQDFTADGNTASSTRRVASGNWNAVSLAPLSKTVDNILSWTLGSGAEPPVAFSTLSGTLLVQAVLNKGSELPLSNDITLDGSATLELAYL